MNHDICRGLSTSTQFVIFMSDLLVYFYVNAKIIYPANPKSPFLTVPYCMSIIFSVIKTSSRNLFKVKALNIINKKQFSGHDDIISYLQVQYIIACLKLIQKFYSIILYVQLQYQFPQNMSKQFICVLLLLSLTLAITDREIIQQSLNGIYEQNKFADPTTITDCDYGDDNVDHEIVVFIGQSLEKASKGSLTEIYTLLINIRDFVNSLPQPVIDCISTNDEVDKLAVAYNVKGADPLAIEKKILNYIALHYLAFHKWMGELDNLWNAGNYYQTGFNGAGYAHQILGMNLANYIRQIRQRRY